MQLRNAPLEPRQQALKVVSSEIGCMGVLIVAVGAGLGTLLDFQVAGLHPLLSVSLLLISVPISVYWTVQRTLRMGRPRRDDYYRNLALASVAGQSGCATVVLIFLALFAGLFLDSRLDTHPIFTIGLVLVSVPFSLYIMVRILMRSVGAINVHPLPEATHSQPASSPASLAEKSHHTKENGS